jgi:hypothetical protein
MRKSRALGLISLIISLQSYGQSTRIGDWTIQVDHDPFFAATSNDSNSLGQFCSEAAHRCFYTVTSQSACDLGIAYPVLLNTDSGVSPNSVVCMGKLENSENYWYTISDFEKMDAMIRQSRRISIAFPIGGERFQIMSFSLEGAGAAIIFMRSVADRVINHEERRSPVPIRDARG